MERWEKITVGVGAYLLSLSVNYIYHISNAVWAGAKANNPITTQEQEQQLKSYRSRCADEAFSKNVFIPGSFIWRAPERPKLDTENNATSTRSSEQPSDLEKI